MKARPTIEKAAGTGFCFGVRRALRRLEAVAAEHGGVESLGPVVHNRQVQRGLEARGVRVAGSEDDIHGTVVVIGAHGISPAVERELADRGIEIIDTTCPFVRRAQRVAARLARAGFTVVVYGDAGHREVKGILGWARGRGLATLDAATVAAIAPPPRYLGVLAQTTQVPAAFTAFARDIVGAVLGKDSELRVIDTICHDIRRRQGAALALARRVDLMLVVGDPASANTNRLAELCSSVVATRFIETAADVQPGWLNGVGSIGVAGGASTAEETIDGVIARLRAITGQS